MADIDEFIIEIKLATDKLNADLGRVTNSLEKNAEVMQKSFNKAFSPRKLQNNLKTNENIISNSILNINKILKGGLYGLGGVLGIQFATDFIKSISEQAGKMQRLELLSSAYGTSAKNLQLLQQVYERSGGTKEEATRDISQLYNRLTSGELDQKLAAAISRLGLKTNMGKKDPALLILDAIKGMGTGGFTATTQNIIRQQLGLSETTLKTIREPKLLNEYMKAVKDNAIDDKDIKNLSEFNRGLQSIGNWFDKFKTKVISKSLSTLFPQLNNEDNNKKREESFIKVLTNDNKKSHWEDVKKSIAMLETSGGVPRQVSKADKNGAYGLYGLRLQTAKDQLKYEHKEEEANKLTPALLRNNNYKLANEISERYFNRMEKAYGLENALKRYRGGNEVDKEIYKNNVLRNMYNMQHQTSKPHGAINHHQVSYNIDNINLHGVDDANGFANELSMLSLTSFNNSRNQLA